MTLHLTLHLPRRTARACATLIAAALWAPAWSFGPLVGPAALGAQQSPSAARSKPAEVDADDDDDKSDDDKSDNDKNDDDQNDDAHTPRSAHHGAAQRVVHVARMMRAGRDTVAPLHVSLNYGAGRLSIVPADAQWLYDLRLSYQPHSEAPVVSYDSSAHRLHVGGPGNHEDHVSINFGDADEDELRVALARTVPLDIALAFGVGEARARLGGLSVRQLKVQTGASDAEISFDRPDPIPLEQLEIDVGAAGFKAVGLGNAHAQHVVVKAGAGDVDLDFSGPWTGNATLEITAALGAVHVHVPSGVIVDRTRGKTVIGSFEDATGGATLPQKAGGPMFHLRVNSTMTLGSVEFDRKTSN